MILPLRQPGIEDRRFGNLPGLGMVGRGQRSARPKPDDQSRPVACETPWPGPAGPRKLSNKRRLGKSSVTRTAAPSTSAARRASANRTSGPGESGVGSPSVRSMMPTQWPCWTSLASVPPQAISTSSGWAPTASTSSGGSTVSDSDSDAASAIRFLFSKRTEREPRRSIPDSPEFEPTTRFYDQSCRANSLS